MAREKQIQMPESWFLAVCRYVAGNESDYETVRQGIMDKFKRNAEHDLYTIMHNPDKTLEEKENARQAYLESKGIPEAFRW